MTTMRRDAQFYTRHADKARAMWAAFTDNERHGVRFGMFPGPAITAAENEGFDHHALCVALMDVASERGGMRA